MKIQIITFFMLMPLCSIFSQEKFDYYWPLGTEGPSDAPEFGGVDIDFTTEPLTQHRIIRNISFESHSTSICNNYGELLFYTNGCHVVNKLHQVMDGGEDLNAGTFHDDYCSPYDGYVSGQQSLIIIPPSYEEGIYYLIHEKVEQGFPDEFSRLYYSVIDMNENGGLGKVTDKNIQIMEDSVYLAEMTAVRHSNGKDWWIVCPEDSNNVYNVLLIDSLGIRKQNEFAMGPKTGYYGGLSGQAKISPDGTKYARYTQTQQLFLMDFDRTTGTLSNFNQYFLRDTVYPGGLEFSPNSRFLYVSDGYFVDQFDLKSSDIQDSKITVAEYDGFVDFLPSFFKYMQLGPDCKIYINTPGGGRWWHVINNPNEKGLSCNLTQHSLRLLAWNFNTMPYFPNYRLGPPGDEGYPCDSSRIVPVTYVSQADREILVFPNPAESEINVNFISPIDDCFIVLLDLTGREVLKENREKETPLSKMDVSGLSSGLYFLQIIENGKTVYTEKVSVVK